MSKTLPSLAVRFANKHDIGQINDLFVEYDSSEMERTGYVKNQSRFLQAINVMLAANSVFVLTKNERIVGAMAGWFIPALFTADTFYSQQFFYVKPSMRKYSVEFLKRLEWILRGTNATRFVLSAPHFSGRSVLLHRFFRMQGYRPLETHYEKVIKQPCPMTAQKA